MIRRSGFLLSLALGTLLLLPGCGGPVRAGVYVGVPPPPLVVEAPPPAPGIGFVWIPGFHRWEGGRYVWVPGRWERPPRGRHVWVQGRWVHTRRGWYRREGHWR